LHLGYMAVGELLPNLSAASPLPSRAFRTTRAFCGGDDHGILCSYFALPFVSTMTSHNANPTRPELGRFSVRSVRRPAPAGGSAQ
jgi:hypothetical protein